MAINKILRKIITWSVVLTLLSPSILCSSPMLPQAEAAAKIPGEYSSFNVIPFLNSLMNLSKVKNQPEESEPNSVNELQAEISSFDSDLIDHKNQTGFSQEEIDKIVNEHMLEQQKEAVSPDAASQLAFYN